MNINTFVEPSKQQDSFMTHSDEFFYRVDADSVDDGGKRCGFNLRSDTGIRSWIFFGCSEPDQICKEQTQKSLARSST
jgi:hypothetical protein